MKTTITVQFQNKEVSIDDALKQAKAQMKAEGVKVSKLLNLNLYVKPEEAAVYYVATKADNTEIKGSLSI